MDSEAYQTIVNKKLKMKYWESQEMGRDDM